MLGAIYVGLSGMNAYANGLKTISNNVANLDTLGYKSSTISFSDVFSGGVPGLGYGGWQNGSSGNGVRYNAESIDFAQGSLQQTGGALDFAIDGNGFLTVENDHGDTFYTRTGQFTVDSKGFVVNQNGDRLTMLDGSNQPTLINVGDRMSNPPAATKTITFSQNLSSSATTADVPNITVHDANGAAHVWDVSLASTTATGGAATQTEWTVTVKDETGATIGTGTIDFNNGISMPGSSSFTINTTPGGAAAMAVTLDFSDVQSFSGGTTSTLTASNVDGNAIGTLTNAAVNDQGQLVLTYSNSQTTTLGSIAIADFRTPQQLVRVGNGRFRNTVSGEVQYKASGAEGMGTLKTGEVEASNVNLTAEFGNLILVQRGFDASSQVISATNDMIQQLFGMRGHG